MRYPRQNVMPDIRVPALAGILAAAALALYPPAARSYQEIEVTDGGTIKGAVTYSGTAPVKSIVPKDAEICGHAHDEPQIVVGANKGVRDAIVYLDGVAKGKPLRKSAKTPELDNKDCVFVPESQVMLPGPIVIVNSDAVLHNTHGFYGKRTAFNVALPNQGQRITQQLDRSGIVRVECDEHGHMHATIYVAENPYFAVTGADGAFTLTDVPPGDYKLVVYQRHTGPVETQVAVKAKETVNVAIDLKK